MNKKLLRRIISLSIVLIIMFGNSIASYIDILRPIGVISVYLLKFLIGPILTTILKIFCPINSPGLSIASCALSVGISGIFIIYGLIGVLFYTLINKLLEKIIK